MLLLTACATGRFELGHTETVVKIVCPSIEEYDAKTQEQALKEYEALPKDSAVRQFVGDYKYLRDKIKACRARQASIPN